MSGAVLILGGGIAGLSAQHHLAKNGVSSLILEAEQDTGGLLRSFEIDGFTFDHAVHLSFASEPEVREVFDKTPFHTHQPEAVNWEAGRWLRHPVQNNLFPLNEEDKLQLINGLIDAHEKPTEGLPVHYGDWLIAQYGRPIAERYPMRYTRKYWRCEAEGLGTDWISQRMRQADLKEVLAGALVENDENTYYVKEMRYPQRGGYYSFIKDLSDNANAETGAHVEGINLTRKEVRLANGGTREFEQLVSTISLPNLILAIDEAPTEIKTIARDLTATSIDLISVGFSRPAVSPSLWFYIYDEWIEAARAYSPDWKSASNVPAGCSALQFEIYSGPNETADRSPQYLLENTRKAILAMGIAKDEDILFMDHRRVRDGNVIFFKGMEEKRRQCHEWLAAHDICWAGRFGEWDYLWSNQAFMSGRRAADRVLQIRG